eukprot:scaffold5.g701.t1
MAKRACKSVGLTLRRPLTTSAPSQTIGPSEVQPVEDQLDADKLGFAYKVRPYLLFCGFFGALLHLLSGYDSGITGGVFTSPTFLQKFYPDATTDITVYTAVFFPFGLIGAIISSVTSRHWGRLSSLRLAAIITILGSLLQARARLLSQDAAKACGRARPSPAPPRLPPLDPRRGVDVFAQNRAMILAGRMILGLGKGFDEHVGVTYLAETAPAQLRGKFVGSSIFFGALGVMAAQARQGSVGWLGGSPGWLLINWGVRNNPNGWQISLGMVCVPSGLVLAASIFMPDSPNSLLVRGKPEAAERALQRLRGPVDVAPELLDLKVAAGTNSPGILAAWRLLASDRSYWPSVITAFLGMTFNWPLPPRPHQEADLALLERLLPGGGAGARITTAALFAVYPPAVMEDPNAGVSKLDELAYMAGQNTTVNAIMGEVPPLVIRSVAWVIITFAMALWGTVPSPPLRSITTYAFTYELCAMKWGIYLFMASIATLLGIWAWLLVPETSRVPIERLQATFEAHWVWKRFFPKGDVERPAFQLEGKAAKEGSDDSGSR